MRHYKKMRKIGDLLSASIEHTEVLKTARSQAVTAQWTEIVGDYLAKNSFPDRFREGVLWVTTNGSAWGQEISLRREQILKELNKRAGEKDFFLDIKVSPFKKKSEPISNTIEQVKKPKN